MLTQRQAALILNGLPGVGPVACRRLSSAFDGDLVAVLFAEKKRLFSVPGIGKTLAEKIFAWREIFDLEKEERTLERHGATFIPFFDDAFPPLLKEIPDPPVGLYVRGNANALASRKTVALVGTRKASLYGTTNAKKIARELAAAGWSVASGGARGIDTAAHEGALEAGGITLCVLGCGLDIVYPPENLELFKKISRSAGAVVSEFPFREKSGQENFSATQPHHRRNFRGNDRRRVRLCGRKYHHRKLCGGLRAHGFRVSRTRGATRLARLPQTDSRRRDACDLRGGYYRRPFGNARATDACSRRTRLGNVRHAHRNGKPFRRSTENSRVAPGRRSTFAGCALRAHRTPVPARFRDAAFAGTRPHCRPKSRRFLRD